MYINLELPPPPTSFAEWKKLGWIDIQADLMFRDRNARLDPKFVQCSKGERF